MLEDCEHFITLLYKCFLIKKYHWLTTLFEIAFPILILLSSTSLILSTPKATHEIPAKSYINQTIDMSNVCKKFYIIVYYPDDNKTSDYIEELKNVMKLNLCKIKEIKSFKTQEDLEDYVYNISSNNSHVYETNIFGLIVEELTENNFKFQIRYQMSHLESLLFSSLYNFDAYSEFLIFQNMVQQTIVYIKFKISKLNIELAHMPTGKQVSSSYSTFSTFLSISFIFGFIFPYILIVKKIIEEKQNRMREMIKMIGIPEYIYWGSLFTNFYLIYALQSGIITSIFFHKIYDKILFKNSNFYVIYFGLLCYGATFILSAMLLSILFKKTIYAVLTSLIFFCVQTVPAYMLINGKLALFSRFPYLFFILIIPNSSVILMLEFVFTSEIESKGVGFYNFFENFTLFGMFSFGSICLTLLASCVIHMILIWYLDNVWPWQYGIPKPFYFPISDFFISSKPQKLEQDFSYLKKPLFEMYDVPFSEGIMIRNLKKTFSSGLKVKNIIDNLSLDVRKGNITVLLGHNGAGKTTTMNIITGMITPTSGTILVNGYDIITNKRQARNKMSLCPQYNFVYEELTIRQHLYLFGRLRNISKEEIKDSIKETAQTLKLTDVLDKRASDLSGGMLRRLCLGMALIGGTEILILDEPTSGLDPETRRELWNAFLNIRLRKTVLLTTHFMEEADALGDKIAIMAAGQLKCYGSPLFLKKAFGTGYQLRFTKTEDFNLDLLNGHIQTFFPNYVMINNTDNEIIYSLNQVNETENESIFGNFFDVIENAKESLGVSSWGLTMTTLEDVFLKVDNLHFEKSTHDDSIKVEKYTKKFDRLKGIMLCCQSLKGLLVKRFHYIRRNWIMFLLQITIPMFSFIFLFQISNLIYKTDTHPFLFDIYKLYGETIGFFSSNVLGNVKFRYAYKQNLIRNKVKPIYLNQSIVVDDYLFDLSEKLDYVSYTTKYLVGLELMEANRFRVWYNVRAIHSGPISLNLFYETYLTNMTQKLFTFEVKNYVFTTSNFLERLIINQDILRYLWLFLLQIPLLFLASSYTLFPIYENMCKSKLLQLMTGLSPLLYWLSNYIVDMTILTICISFIIFTILIFDTYMLISLNIIMLFSIGVIIFIFGFTTISISYLSSLVFKTPTNGFLFLLTFYLIGLFNSIVVKIVKELDIIDEYEDYVNFFALLIPVYAASSSILDIMKISQDALICKHMVNNCHNNNNRYKFICCKEFCRSKCFKAKNPLLFEIEDVNKACLIMLIEGIIILFILIIYEYGLRSLLVIFKNTKVEKDTKLLKEPEDADVTAEKVQVTNLIKTKQTIKETLVVDSLTKHFKKFKAVKGITFVIHHNECFGLLGVNGAGKTTTFRMLVGEILPTFGNAYIETYDLLNNCRQFQQSIGYCPQFDALLEDLTGEEMLYLFARLRGIPENDLKEEVSYLIDMADLKENYFKQLKNCSGGNKRKVSLIMSIIGDPKLLLLDEPTTGVDPVGRRKIWDLLNLLKKERNISMLLTSHSMDECEALCSRIAIMAAGKLQCIGSLQHLRNKYGKEYFLFIKVKKENDIYINNLLNAIYEIFPSSNLKNRYQKNLEFNITDKRLKWSFLFKEMKKIKEKFDLEDFILSDASLEQIFLSFARTATQTN